MEGFVFWMEFVVMNEGACVMNGGVCAMNGGVCVIHAGAPLNGGVDTILSGAW